MKEKITFVKNRETERQAQRAVVQYVRLKYPDVLIFAVPNGGSRNKIEAGNLKKDGVLAGVPDLFVARAKIYREFFDDGDGKKIDIDALSEKQFKKVKISEKIYSLGLFIEMKSAKGKLSDSQVDVMNKLSSEGYQCEVCYSSDEAIKVIDEYLG